MWARTKQVKSSSLSLSLCLSPLSAHTLYICIVLAMHEDTCAHMWRFSPHVIPASDWTGNNVEHFDPNDLSQIFFDFRDLETTLTQEMLTWNPCNISYLEAKSKENQSKIFFFFRSSGYVHVVYPISSASHPFRGQPEGENKEKERMHQRSLPGQFAKNRLRSWTRMT